MRVLVLPNDLVLGGSSLNAVELASSLQRRGHVVLLAAPSGPLLDQVHQHELDYRELPPSPNRPTAGGTRATLSVARRFRPDLIHSYEFGPFLNTSYGPGLLGTPHLATVMSMWFPGWLPKAVPVTLGTRQMVDEARPGRRAPVWLLEPPVDMSLHRLAADVPDGSFRHRHAIPEQSLVVTLVSRFDREMKLEGILDLLSAVDRLPAGLDVVLLLVGGGPSAADIRSRADEVNAHHRGRVVLTGPLEDPRPAYATADVVAGMGSSIIKAMAFGKPAVVLGMEGFVRAVDPSTFAHFDRHGFWGVGSDGCRVTELQLVLRRLLEDEGARHRIGRWSADAVRDRFSLERGTTALEHLYRQTIEGRPGVPARAMAVGETSLHFTPPPVRNALAGAHHHLVARRRERPATS